MLFEYHLCRVLSEYICKLHKINTLVIQLKQVMSHKHKPKNGSVQQ